MWQQQSAQTQQQEQQSWGEDAAEQEWPEQTQAFRKTPVKAGPMPLKQELVESVAGETERQAKIRKTEKFRQQAKDEVAGEWQFAHNMKTLEEILAEWEGSVADAEDCFEIFLKRKQKEKKETFVAIFEEVVAFAEESFAKTWPLAVHYVQGLELTEFRDIFGIQRCTQWKLDHVMKEVVLKQKEKKDVLEKMLAALKEKLAAIKEEAEKILRLAAPLAQETARDINKVLTEARDAVRKVEKQATEMFKVLPSLTGASAERLEELSAQAETFMSALAEAQRLLLLGQEGGLATEAKVEFARLHLRWKASDRKGRAAAETVEVKLRELEEPAVERKVAREVIKRWQAQKMLKQLHHDDVDKSSVDPAQGANELFS